MGLRWQGTTQSLLVTPSRNTWQQGPPPARASAHLDEQLPLRVVARGDRVVQVGRGVAVVAAAHHDRLILQQVLHACAAAASRSETLPCCAWRRAAEPYRSSPAVPCGRRADRA